MMKTFQHTLFVLSIIWSCEISAQDCYYPPSGSILYTTDKESYNLPSLTGLVSSGDLLSGNWNIVSSTGNVEASMVDNSGRTSTLQLSGKGRITISNIQTDLTDDSNVELHCEQTFEVRPYSSRIVNNPKLESVCPIKVVVVIDESASILNSQIDGSIRNGVMLFSNLLSNSGSEMAVVEYDSKARRVDINGSSELQQVTPDFLDGLENYLHTDYNPISDQFKLVGGTNWQDALLYANKVRDAEFILMLTDGNPTFYNIPNSPKGAIAGEGEQFDLTALKNAQDVANTIKRSNKHLFVIGVEIPNSKQALVDITGFDEFKFGGDLNSFINSDYISVNADEIEKIFTKVGIETCGNLIPTIGEWGLIHLSLLLLIVAVVSIKNTSRIKNSSGMVS